MPRQLDLGVLFRGQVDPSFLSSIQQLREAINNLTQGLSGNLGAALGGLTRQATSTSGAVDNTRRSLRRLGDESSDVGKRISLIEGGLQRLVNSFKVVASYGVAGGLTYALFGGLKEGVDTIFEFDQALANMAALTGSAAGEIAAFGETTKDVLRTTKFSVKELGEMSVVIAQAGFSAVETMSVMKAASDMTMGSLEGMRSAVDLLTTTLRTYNIDASRASEVADVMTAAVNNSKLTIDGLRVAMNYIGPVAAAAGFSINETAAAMGVLSNNGLRFSTIGTSLRNIISRLIAPNESLRQTMIQSGVNMAVFRKETLTLREVIQELTKMVPNASKAFELFGLRAAPAALALANAGVQGFDQMVASVSEIGAASKAAETAMGGLINQSLNFYNRLKLVAIAIGEGGVASAMKVFYTSMRPLISSLEYLAGTTVGKVIIAFTALTAILSTTIFLLRALGLTMASMAFGTTISAVSVATKTMGAWSVAADASKASVINLFNVIKGHPFAALLIAISAGVAAWYTYKTAQEEALVVAQKETVEAEAKIRKLETLRAQLEKTTGGSEEYKAILARIIEIAPEVQSSLDGITGKFNDQGVALDNLINKNYVEWLGKLLEVFKKLNAEAERSEKSKAPWAGEQGTPTTGFAEFAPTQDLQEATKRSQTFTWTVQEATKALMGYAKTANMTRDQVRQALTDLGYNQLKDFNLIVDDVSKGLDRITESQIKTKDKILKGTGQALPDFFNQFFDTTDIVTRSRLLKTYDSITKELGRTSKAIDTMSKSVTEGAKEAGEAVQDELSHLEYTNVANQEYEAMKKMSDAIKDANRWAIDESEATYNKRKNIITSYTQFRVQQLEQEKQAEVDAAKADIETFKTNIHDRDRLAKAIETRQRRAETTVSAITVLQQKGVYDAEKSALKELDQEQAVIREKMGKRAEAQHRREVRMTKEALKEESNLLESRLLETRLLAEEGKIPSKNVFEAEVEYHKQSAEMWKAHSEEVRARLGEQSDEYRSAMQKALQHTVEGNKLITSALKKEYEDRLINTRDYSEEWLSIQEEMYNQGFITAKQWESAQRKYFLYYHQYDEEAFKQGKISLEEYFNYLDKLLEEGQINWRDYWDKVVIAGGSASQVVGLAFERTQGRMLTWNETLYRTATELPDVFASNFTSAFRSFADGSKTAAQAWQDFSQNMLFWLGEILVKYMVMKAVMGVGGLGGGNVGSGGFIASMITGIGSLFSGSFGWDKALGMAGIGVPAPYHHFGGIIGKDYPSSVKMVFAKEFDNAQRLHSGGIAGIKSDERAVVMKEGEGAFTEEQMKRLSPTGAGTLNITNIIDPRTIDAYMATPQGKRSVLNIIGNESLKVKRLLYSS